MDTVSSTLPKQRRTLTRLSSSDVMLLCGTMLVYACVRFVRLEHFPIFFFCDEAIETNRAIRGTEFSRGLVMSPICARSRLFSWRCRSCKRRENVGRGGGVSPVQ
jgi:hypothetical protein